MKGDYKRVKRQNGAIPGNVLRIIKERGMRQAFVAEKAGFKNYQFYELMNGRRIIRAVDIAAIAEALNVTPNELFGIKARDAPRKRKKRTEAVTP